MTFCKLAGVVALLLGNGAFAWPTTTIDHAATTFTETASTVTEEGFTFTRSGTTEVEIPTTITAVATTVTYGAWTEEYLLEPSEIQTIGGADEQEAILNALYNFAPDVTSIDPAVASKLASDLNALSASYAATAPLTGILTQINEDLNSAIPPGQDLGNPLWNSIENDLDPYEPSSAVAELAALVSAYPTLSAEVMEYLSVASTWYAPYLLAEASIVSKDLSLTGAPPSWMSFLTQASATGTPANTSATTTATTPGGTPGGTPGTSPSSTTSTAGAVPTRGAAVMMNAGAAAAGMAVLALL